MTLSSKTKNLVQVGTKLKGYKSIYIVTLLENCGNAKYITIQDMETKQNIYFQGISKYYGMEIL